MVSWQDRVDMLRSPICGEPLAWDQGRIVCATCRLMFPIIDGIPALLESEARELSGERADVEARCPKRR